MKKVEPTEPISIIVAADAAYAMPLTVTLHSALRRLDKHREVEIVIADGGLGAANCARIQTALGGAHPRMTLRFVAPQMERFASFNSGIYSRSTYLRIMVPEFFPRGRKKALYLDSDILVTTNLAPLWDTDLGSFPVWAVQDYALGAFDEFVRDRFPEIEAPADAVYFNAGMLLFNLPVWETEKISERAFQFLDQHSHRLSFPDQDALNATLAGNWGRLDPRWNIQVSNVGVVPSLEMPTNGPPNQAAVDSLSGICHFTVAKPWHPEYTGKLSWSWACETVRTGWRSFSHAASLWARQAVARNGARIRRRLNFLSPPQVRADEV